MKRFVPIIAIASIVVAACVTSAPATTIRVPEDHDNIQAAVLASSPGDTVLVGPGTYTELVRMRPDIVLRSSHGPDSTLLVSPGLAEKVIDERVIECLEGDRSTVIEGFSMDAADAAGCAIYVENASPTIRGNVFTGFGWGINLRFSKALVEENEITNGKSFGILCFASSPEIYRNSIHDCPGTGISVSGKESHPVIGGSAENANRLYANAKSIVNQSRNEVNATYNDWGWDTTAEMEAEAWPADIEAIMDGNDRKRSHRGKGKVDYRNWIRPQAAGVDVSAETESPSAMRIAVPVVIALVLIVGFVGMSRRRRATSP